MNEPTGGQQHKGGKEIESAVSARHQIRRTNTHTHTQREQTQAGKAKDRDRAPTNNEGQTPRNARAFSGTTTK